jgi:hypothetical protein
LRPRNPDGSCRPVTAGRRCCCTRVEQHGTTPARHAGGRFASGVSRGTPASASTGGLLGTSRTVRPCGIWVRRRRVVRRAERADLGGQARHLQRSVLQSSAALDVADRSDPRESQSDKWRNGPRWTAEHNEIWRRGIITVIAASC